MCRTPQPSTARGISAGSTSAAAAISGGTACWTGWLGQAVAALSQPRARQSASIPACLPEQLCSIRVGSGAALELVLPGRRRGQQALDRVELLGPREVGRAGDRELLVGEVRASARERQRLQRLRGRTQEADEARVACLEDDGAVLDRDDVHDVPGLDHVAARDEDGQGLHGGSVVRAAARTSTGPAAMSNWTFVQCAALDGARGWVGASEANGVCGGASVVTPFRRAFGRGAAAGDEGRFTRRRTDAPGDRGVRGHVRPGDRT